jgi:hypothetical protein
MNLLFKIKKHNGILKTEKKHHDHTIDPTPHRFTPD